MIFVWAHRQWSVCLLHFDNEKKVTSLANRKLSVGNSMRFFSFPAYFESTTRCEKAYDFGDEPYYQIYD